VPEGGAVDVGKAAKDANLMALLGLFLFDGHPDWIAANYDQFVRPGPARGHPLAPLGGSAKLGLEGGHTVLDALVVDQADELGVARVGRTQGEGDGHTADSSSLASSCPALWSAANSSSVRRTPSLIPVRGAGPRSR
jgi:hypothetical protein